VRIVSLNKNVGFGRANNVGLSLAIKEQWDYVFLLNQDAEIYPETIRDLISTATKNQEYGIVSPVHLDASKKNLDPSFMYYLKKNSDNNYITDYLLQRPPKPIYSFNMINAAA